MIVVRMLRTGVGLSSVAMLVSDHGRTTWRAVMEGDV